MIKLKNVCKTYQSEAVETLALNQVNLTINAGEFVAIMGPSGCGKSSLLNILGLLDNPNSGEYLFQQENVTAYKEKKLARIRKRHIGFIFQNFNLIDELNVEENIGLALLYHDISSKERKARVSEAMDKVAIAHRARHFPSQLSGGQQQRVAVARAVVGNQALILADEPTGNLDSAHGTEVMNILLNLNQQGTAIVMVTHSLQHADYASRKIQLFDGKILSQSASAA